MGSLIQLSRLETGNEAELAPWFDEYNRQVGYYVGRANGADGQASLSCLEDRKEGEVFELYKILFGPNEVGFLCTSMAEGDERWILRAIFILPSYRRQRIGTSAIATVVKQWPCNWILEFPLRLQAASQFADRVLTALNAKKVRVRESNWEGLGTFRSIEFSLEPTLGVGAIGATGVLDEVGLSNKARAHHGNRRAVLGLAVFTSVFTLAVADAAEVLAFLCSLISFLLWLTYFEIIVTGILDRLDRGPQLAIRTRKERG